MALNCLKNGEVFLICVWQSMWNEQNRIYSFQQLTSN